MRPPSNKTPRLSESPGYRPVALAAALIVLLGFAAYANSFAGAFVYDDRTAVAENESIRQLWPPFAALLPPAEAGTGGRPLANLTFAVSYALSGFAPWGYHLVNIVIHVLAALALFGVVRRTLGQPSLREHFGAHALPLGATIAGLWAVHPLQTQVVTYISQRTESLMALFYLLTLYCFIRGSERHPQRWFPLAALACLLGAMSKEVIATVPLVVLLYDRTFVAGSFVSALRQRAKLYGALAATWLPLAYFLIGVRERGVGYGLGIPWMDYALTETKAVVLYATLGVWPHPLIFDRGVLLLGDLAKAAPFVFALAALLTVTVWALRSRPALGFAAASFFIVLAPTSSVIPVIQQPIAENRAYLPLAATLSLLVLGLHRLAGRRATLALCAVLAVGAIFATAARNRVFANEISLWSDTVEKAPANARAHYNLGVALDYAGRKQEAMASYRAALALLPDYPEPNNNLGNALAEQGRHEEAIPFLKTAVRLRPAYADAHYNLGNSLMHTGQPAAAIPHYQLSLRLDPRRPKAVNNLGICFLQTGRPDEAIQEFARAVALQEDFFDARSNLAVVLSQRNRHSEALRHAEIAARLRPESREAQQRLAVIRARAARAGETP